MFDLETTPVMLNMSPELPPVPTPFHMLAKPNRQYLLSRLGHSMLCVWIVLDFVMEILIIHSRPHRISTQCISIRMSHPRSVDYFEAIVLQHVNPSTPSSMRIRHSCQPFEWLMVRPQCEMSLRFPRSKHNTLLPWGETSFVPPSMPCWRRL
jgi:hypothetical protein